MCRNIYIAKFNNNHIINLVKRINKYVSNWYYKKCRYIKSIKKCSMKSESSGYYVEWVDENGIHKKCFCDIKEYFDDVNIPQQTSNFKIDEKVEIIGNGIKGIIIGVYYDIHSTVYYVEWLEWLDDVRQVKYYSTSELKSLNMEI